MSAEIILLPLREEIDCTGREPVSIGAAVRRAIRQSAWRRLVAAQQAYKADPSPVTRRSLDEAAADYALILREMKR